MSASPANEPCADCPGRLVCRCLRVTENVLVEALAGGDVRSVTDIQRRTGAGEGCTACHVLLKRYLQAGSSLAPICSAR